jgi:hypothetical protein
MKFKDAIRLAITAVCLAAFSLSSRAVVASVDQIAVTRNGGSFFTDGFDDGLEPPNGPSGATTYFLQGTISPNAETGGRLLIDSSTGIASDNAISDPRLFLGVQLLSDISSNLSLGLKNDDTIVFSATFGLVIPQGPLYSGYGIRFIDANTQQVIQLQIRVPTNTNQAEISYLEQDFVAKTITFLGSTPLAPPAGTDQISLSLSRPNISNNDFYASFSYLAGGAVVGSGSFDVPGQMFEGENFVRAQFFAAQEVVVAAIPEPETYALMVAGLAVLGAVARRRIGRSQLSSSRL